MIQKKTGGTSFFKWGHFWGVPSVQDVQRLRGARTEGTPQK